MRITLEADDPSGLGRAYVDSDARGQERVRWVELSPAVLRALENDPRFGLRLVVQGDGLV